MTSAYDILGVIFGVISLLVFVEHARRFINTRLPPGRLHTVQGALAGARLLIERLERTGCFQGVSDAAGAYRRRVNELDKEADVLWIETERWRRMGLTRRFLPANRVELVRACNQLQREIDDVCADL